MRINANSTLTADDVYAAARKAATEYGQDIYIDDITTGPKGAISFYAAANHGRYHVNRDSEARAASWTAWGYLITELFNRDPSAHIGQYKSLDNFIEQIYKAQQRHYNRQAFGIVIRKGEAGEDISFLATAVRFSD